MAFVKGSLAQYRLWTINLMTSTKDVNHNHNHQEYADALPKKRISE
jgi:hypothetical protein